MKEFVVSSSIDQASSFIDWANLLCSHCQAEVWHLLTVRFNAAGKIHASSFIASTIQLLRHFG